MKNKIGFIVAAVVVGLLGVLLYVSAAAREPVKVDSGYRVIMGTFSRVVVVARNDMERKTQLHAFVPTVMEKVREGMLPRAIRLLGQGV